MIRVMINGEPRELSSSRSIEDLVAELGLEAPLVLIEHNGTALRRSEWSGTCLAESDRIEILRVAAGG